MAKVALTKLTAIKNAEEKIIKINDTEVSVKQYLPIEEKGNITDEIIGNVFDSNYIASPIRLQIYFYLAVIRHYTNISLTDTMMKNAGKTYDALSLNGIFDAVIAAIPEEEFNDTFDLVSESIEKIATYYQSFLGILKVTSQDYSQTSMDATKVLEELRNPAELNLVKDILTKMQ